MIKRHNTLPLLFHGKHTLQKFSSEVGYVYVVQWEDGLVLPDYPRWGWEDSRRWENEMMLGQ
jgi:hypothetical protein